MKGLRSIELSFELFPGKEEYGLKTRNRYVDEMLPHYRGKRPPGAWYIMSELELGSHVGTHMESPYHYIKDGKDISQVPLGQVVGECALIDCTDKGVGEPIHRRDLEERGRDVRTGDIVFVHTGLSHLYRTERSHDRPYFEVEAIRWLVEVGISCLGVDCSGIENREESAQPCHELLFSNGIPLIEHLANLDRLRTRRFFVVAVPWRVRGLEASPVSVVAFEQDETQEDGSTLQRGE